MIAINLFPWRAAQRHQQRRQFFILIACAVGITMISLFLWRMILMKNIQQSRQHNQQLQREITQQQQSLSALPAMEIPAIKPPSINLAKFIESLPQLIPPNVYLTQIKLVAKTIDLLGYAHSYEKVLRFVQTLEAASWKTQLKSIDGNKFYVQITRIQP